MKDKLNGCTYTHFHWYSMYNCVLCFHPSNKTHIRDIFCSSTLSALRHRREFPVNLLFVKKSLAQHARVTGQDLHIHQRRGQKMHEKIEDDQPSSSYLSRALYQCPQKVSDSNLFLFFLLTDEFLGRTKVRRKEVIHIHTRNKKGWSTLFVLNMSTLYVIFYYRLLVNQEGKSENLTYRN